MIEQRKKKLAIGDWGTEIVLDTEDDITGATELQIVGKMPNGDPIEWDAVVEGTTKVKYVTQEGDHGEVVGNIEVMSRVASPAGRWTGNDVVKIPVVDPGV